MSKKDTMELVYKGGLNSIKFGKYVFHKDKPREVPKDVGEKLLKKSQPLQRWNASKKRPKKTKSELTKEEIKNIQSSC